MAKKNLNWAVLGTGTIANEMAQAALSAGRKFYSVGNRTISKAQQFAEKYQISKVYSDFREMFTDEAVDVIYIATPHNTHFPWMMEALRNGKHVLVEKAITLSSAELTAAIRLAEEMNLVLAEAQTVYHMPLHKELLSRVRSGEFGPVRMIQINFGSYKEYDMENRFFNLDLAGGALLDIGVYAISMARYFMDSKPDSVISRVHFAESGTDEMSGIVLDNQEGQMAVLSVSLHAKQPKRAVISCDKAYVEIMDYPRASEAKIVDAVAGACETVRLGDTKKALWYEMEDMEQAIGERMERAGKTECIRNEEKDGGSEKLMHLGFTEDVMEIMTKLRQDWGLCYGTEAAPGIPKYEQAEE